MALENETGHQVFRAMQTVRFENKCADAIPHQVQAYAELRSEEGSARALVLVYARRGASRGQEMFVGARLVAMRLEAAVAGANWSVSLEAHTAGGRYVGVKHSHYICCPSRGEGRRRPFRTDSTGVLEWLDSPEPFGGKWSGMYPCNCSPKMETTASVLGIADEIRDVTLNLVLTDVGDGNTVRLCGPGIRVPDRIWNERRSESSVSGQFDSLNLFGRFGLWQRLSRAARCWGCIRERRRAKRNHAVR